MTSTGATATAGVSGSPYTITPSAATGTGLANYTITYNPAPTGLTVSPAALTITANNVNKTYGAVLTGGTGSAAFSSTGLQNSESIYDVAKTLSRYVHCIVARVFNNKDIFELAQHADVPVINALCDLYHPCQALADIQTIRERFGSFKGLTLAYVGDGNNVFHSLMMACAKVGVHVRFAGPKGYDPDPEIVRHARGIAKKNKCTIELGRDPKEAVKGADVIYSDVWVSMGQEKETAKRVKEFKGYQINKDLMKLADKNYIFMHCLPAHRGLEVTADIIDGKHSVVFDQAENRLHAQKAVLLKLM